MTETITEIPKEVEKALESQDIILGLKQVKGLIKSGEAELVIFASNSPEDVVKNLEELSKLSNTSIKQYSGTNAELGIKLKRAHSVMVAAVAKSK